MFSIECTVALTFENFVRGVELGTGCNVCGSVLEDSLPESGHVLVWGEAQGVNGYGGGRGGAGGKGAVKIPVGVREEEGEEEGFFKAKR